MSKPSLICAACVVVVGLSACAKDYRDAMYARAYRKADSRTALQASALVLPIQNCTAHEQGTQMNGPAEKLADTVVPGTVWTALHLPGTPRETADPDGPLCAIATRRGAWQDWDPNYEADFELNAVEKNVVRGVLAKHAGKSALVMPYRYMIVRSEREQATVRDRQGSIVGSIDTNKMDYRQTGRVMFGVFVVTADGVLWKNQADCGQNAWLPVCRNDDYTGIEKAGAYLADGFPWPVVGLQGELGAKGAYASPPAGKLASLEIIDAPDEAPADASRARSPSTEHAALAVATETVAPPGGANIASAQAPAPSDSAGSEAHGQSTSPLLKRHQHVEVKSGSEWRKASIVDIDEGTARYKVHYNGSRDTEWVSSDHVRGVAK